MCGEVLGHRVDDHHVWVVKVAQRVNLDGRANAYVDLVSQDRLCLCHIVDESSGRRGRVKSDIAVEIVDEIEQDHTSPGSNLQDIAWLSAIAVHVVYGIIQPLVHFSGVDELAVVHGRPTHKVSANLGCLDCFDIGIGTIFKQIPPRFDLFLKSAVIGVVLALGVLFSSSIRDIALNSDKTNKLRWLTLRLVHQSHRIADRFIA